MVIIVSQYQQYVSKKAEEFGKESKNPRIKNITEKVVSLTNSKENQGEN